MSSLPCSSCTRRTMSLQGHAVCAQRYCLMYGPGPGLGLCSAVRPPSVTSSAVHAFAGNTLRQPAHRTSSGAAAAPGCQQPPELFTHTHSHTHRISCGLSRLAVEVPTCVPYCCDTAAAFCRSSSSGTSLGRVGRGRQQSEEVREKEQCGCHVATAFCCRSSAATSLQQGQMQGGMERCGLWWQRLVWRRRWSEQRPQRQAGTSPGQPCRAPVRDHSPMHHCCGACRCKLLEDAIADAGAAACNTIQQRRRRRSAAVSGGGGQRRRGDRVGVPPGPPAVVNYL